MKRPDNYSGLFIFGPSILVSGQIDFVILGKNQDY